MPSIDCSTAELSFLTFSSTRWRSVSSVSN
jgi:hypothetical protein